VGDIDIDAIGTVVISDASFIVNVPVLGDRNGGNINIIGQNINILGGSIIATPSFSDGNAGTVNIQANDTINFVLVRMEMLVELSPVLHP
jgi:large exoprotein involved in heme utilization and adhesion